MQPAGLEGLGVSPAWNTLLLEARGPVGLGRSPEPRRTARTSCWEVWNTHTMYCHRASHTHTHAHTHTVYSNCAPQTHIPTQWTITNTHTHTIYCHRAPHTHTHTPRWMGWQPGLLQRENRKTYADSEYTCVCVLSVCVVWGGGGGAGVGGRGLGS